MFVISLGEDEARSLADEITEAGGSCSWSRADLTDEEQTAAAFAAVRKEYGEIDGLFAVAGGNGRRFGSMMFSTAYAP